MKESIDWLVDKPFSHRGLHSNPDCPENSLCAFKRSIEYGYPIELDIHVIASGEVVVFHDDDLFRMTGMYGKIEDTDLEVIENLRLYDTNEKIPKLKEVLDLIDGKVPVLIEIKNNKNKKGIEKLILEDLHNYKGFFAIQSFNPTTLHWFKQNAPEIIRGQLSGDFCGENMSLAKKIVRRFMLLNWISKPHFISYDVKACPLWILKLIKRRYLLLLWTIENDKEINKAKLAGDNFIFELENNDVS